MRALTQRVRTILDATTFFAMLYVTYLCTYLAPTHHLRSWGATTSWLLIGFGPARPTEVIRAYSMAELRDHPLIPAIGVPVAGALGQASSSWVGSISNP